MFKMFSLSANITEMGRAKSPFAFFYLKSDKESCKPFLRNPLVNHCMSFLPDNAFLHTYIVWCMKFKKALNKEKNTPVIRRNENGLKLKLIITSFNIRLLTLQKKFCVIVLTSK